MSRWSLPSPVRDETGQLRLPFRLVWNDEERRPRALVRLGAGVVLIFLFAGLGSQYAPDLLSGGGQIIGAVDQLVSVLPQAAGISLGVVLACLLLDRRRLTDVGLDVDSGWWRGLAGGTALGVGITALSVVVGLMDGYYEFAGVRGGEPAAWPVLAVAAAGFQLLYLVPEELFVRGYVITNVVEGFDGVPWVSRGAAAGVGVAAASLVFYATHAVRGGAFGVMAAGVAVLLGVGYVLSGNLSVPIGIHFGFNFAGVLAGTNVQPASLFRLTATGSVDAQTVLPLEAVVVRLAGAVLGVVLLVWWYRVADGRVRIDPTIPRPTLRWRRDDDGTNVQS